MDEKIPHIHIFLSTVDFSFDKHKGREVFKLSTARLTENSYNILQTSIWNHKAFFGTFFVFYIFKIVDLIIMLNIPNSSLNQTK